MAESSGNPKFETRLPQEIHDDLAAMKAAGMEAREILATVTDLWKRADRPDDFLRRMAALSDAEAVRREQGERLRQKARELTTREKELGAREQEAARRLDEVKARVQRAEREGAAREARSFLQAQALDAGEALLREGAKPQDVAAVFFVMRASALRPEGVAAEVQRLGGLNKALAAYTKREGELRAEVAALEQQKAELLGAVRDTTKDVAETVADEMRQNFAKIGLTAERMRAANEHASGQLTKTARTFREHMAKLADADRLGREALGRLVETVGPVALAAQLVALQIKQAGDVELPRELGETIYAPRLSWAESKLRKLAAQVAPNVLAAPAQAPPEGGQGA